MFVLSRLRDHQSQTFLLPIVIYWKLTTEIGTQQTVAIYSTQYNFKYTPYEEDSQNRSDTWFRTGDVVPEITLIRY
jgi:hypothetical protein